MKQTKFYQSENETSTKELNLKLSSYLFEEPQSYSKSSKYTNMQELI
ncbi:MAG: hypothetical protein ACLFPL_00420 [Candidatus Nanoarchaeia archaeon]